MGDDGSLNVNHPEIEADVKDHLFTCIVVRYARFSHTHTSMDPKTIWTPKTHQSKWYLF